MGRSKTLAEPGEAPPSRDGEWAGCPGCGHERRVELGSIIVQHRVWIPDLALMVPCPGSGRRVALIEA